MTSAGRSGSSGAGSAEPSDLMPDSLPLQRQYTDLLHHVRTAVISHLDEGPGDVTLLQGQGKDEMELHVYHHHHISLDKPPNGARTNDQPSLLKKRKDDEEVANKTLLDILWSKNQPFYNSSLNSAKKSPLKNKRREGAAGPLRQDSAVSPIESSKGSKISEPTRVSPNHKSRGSFNQSYSPASKKLGTGDKEKPLGKSNIQSLEEAAQRRIRKLSDLGSLVSPTDDGLTDDSQLAETRWQKDARRFSTPKQGTFEEETQAAQESFLAAARAAKERLRSLINECANSNAGCDPEEEDYRQKQLQALESSICDDTGDSEPKPTPSEMRPFSPLSVVSSEPASSTQYASDVSTTSTHYPSQEVKPTYGTMEEEPEDMICLDNLSIEDILRKRRTPTPSKERKGDCSEGSGHHRIAEEQRDCRQSHENPAPGGKQDELDRSHNQYRPSSPNGEQLSSDSQVQKQTRSPQQPCPSPKQQLMHQQPQDLLHLRHLSPKQEYPFQTGVEHVYPQQRTPQQPSPKQAFGRPPRPSPKQEAFHQPITVCSQDAWQQPYSSQQSSQQPSHRQAPEPLTESAFMARDLSSVEKLQSHPFTELTPQRRSLQQWGWKYPGKLGSDIEEDFHLSSAAEYRRLFAGEAALRGAGEHVSATQEHSFRSSPANDGQEHTPQRTREYASQMPREHTAERPERSPTAITKLYEAAGPSDRVGESGSQSTSARVQPEVAKLISGLALNNIEEALATLDKKMANVANLRHQVVDALISGEDIHQANNCEAAAEKRAQASYGKDKDLESLKKIKKRLKQELQQIWDKNEASAGLKVDEPEFEKLKQANKMLQLELDKLQRRKFSDIKKQNLMQKFNTLLNEAENLHFSLSVTREAIVKEEEKNCLLSNRFGIQANIYGREQAILKSAKRLNSEMIERLSRMEDAVSTFSAFTKNLLPFLEEHLATSKSLSSRDKPEEDATFQKLPIKAHQEQAPCKPVLTREEQNKQLEAFKQAAELKRQQINELIGLNQEAIHKTDERPRDESLEKSQAYNQTKEVVQIMDTLQHHYNVLKTKYTEMEGEMVRRQRLAAGEDDSAVKRVDRSSRNNKQETKGRVERLERMKKELQGRLRLLEDEIRASSQQIQELKGQSAVMKGLMSSKEDEADAIRREAKEISERVMQLEQELMEKEGQVSVLPTSLSPSDESA